MEAIRPSDQTDTAMSLIEYLDHLVVSGQASRGAIRHLKTAFTKVLSTVKGTQWRDIDVDTIVLDEYMESFKKLTDTNYTPGSLATYQQRIEKVLNWYAHVRKDPTWSPYPQSSTQYLSKKPESIANVRSIAPTSPVSNDNDAQHAVKDATQPNFVTYPFPLSNGALIEIKLPLRLSRHDADRISNFIQSIATNEHEAMGAKM